MMHKCFLYSQRHKYSAFRYSSYMIKYHDISYSVPKMVLRNVTVRTVFRIVSAVTIPKNHMWYRIVIFSRLEGIPNVAPLVPPMVPTTK